MNSTSNVNIERITPLISPEALREKMPASAAIEETVCSSREAVKNILTGKDNRLVVVVGPCSIHNEQMGLEYAAKLAKLADEVQDRLVLVMRVYFEKPRTTVGWKGLINDPHLNDTFDIATGMEMARKILLEIGEMGLPVATEMLEPITPQYIADLITLASIGARTTESPTHRQMASGLSMPVGFKNGTDGSLETPINAMISAQSGHSFLGIDSDGRTCVVSTKGNPWGHLILRGGRSGPNYDKASLEHAAERLIIADQSPRLLVDCSHANSNKDYKRQRIVWQDVLSQRLAGNESIIGMMLESNLYEGSQSLGEDLSQLKYGVSITDACIGWEETDELIRAAYEQLSPVSI